MAAMAATFSLRTPPIPNFCTSSSSSTATTSNPRPAVILPGLGNNTADYGSLQTRLGDQYGVSSVVAKVNRIDWLRNAAGGKLSLIGHSAGGWLARVYMEEFGVSDIALLLTLGTPHLPPPRGIPGVIDQTRGLLYYVEDHCRKAVVTPELKYVCVAGRIAVEIDLTNPPPKGVFVDGMWQVVEYENLSSFVGSVDVSVMSAEPSVAAATLSSLPSSPSPTTVPPSHCSDDPEPIDVSMTDHNSGLLHMTSVTQKLQSPSPISSVLELQFPTSISTTSSLPDSSVLPPFENPKQTRRGTQPRKALGLRSIRDDLVLFSEASTQQASTILHILDTFCAASGFWHDSTSDPIGSRLDDLGSGAFRYIKGQRIVGSDSEEQVGSVVPVADDVLLADLVDPGVPGPSPFRARFVGQGYKQVCGRADVWGDGVVPEESAHLEGALNISLDGVYHSPIGSDDSQRPWYGSTGVIEQWVHHLLH
ncbi:hypothetical protein LINGRAHAP2_LOCUS1290 [Linum grandiflorum]